MTDYEKASLLYLAQIVGLLRLLASENFPSTVEDMAKELQHDLRKFTSPEVLAVLSATR